MKKRIGLILLAMLLTITGAGAESLTRPGGLLEIGEEAFAGNGAITEVILQEGMIRIGARAFAGCTGLKRVTLPETLETIGGDACADCGEALLFRCPAGSAAAAWPCAHIGIEAFKTHRQVFYESIPCRACSSLDYVRVG